MIGEEKISFLSQIISSMNELGSKLEEAHRRRDTAKVNMIKLEILELQKKLALELGGENHGD